MFKIVTKLLGVIALTGWMGVANATLIFDFSWDSNNGNGKIIGEITGLTNDGGIQSATGIVLSSIDGVLVDIDVVNDQGWVVGSNLFKVVDYEVTNFDFYSSRNEGNNVGAYLTLTTLKLYAAFRESNDSLTYETLGIAFVKRVTVPEPSTVILLSLGLAGLSFARYRI
jgi:hypothetical protein